MCRPRGWSEQRTEPWDSYWGTISTVQLTTACCEDFDGDGIAAHQFCGSESGLIDCDDSDPTVGHDCELRVESVSFDFTRRYKDLVAASSVDLQHFDAPETIGAAEDCSGTADTNGDGYTPAQSYRCSPPPPGEEAHQVSEEFPIANVKVGVEKSEFVCVPTVSLGAWNEPEGRGVRVAIERKRGGGPWTKLYETELRAEWCLGNQDPRCAVLYTARQSDRGSLLRCVVRPKGGGAQAPPYSRREKVAYAAVAHRTLLGLSARANVRGSYSIYLYQPRLRAPRPNLFIDVSSASSATGATPEALKRALESASSKLDENSFRWRTKRIYLRHDPMVPAPFLFTAQPTPTLVLGGEINSENVFRVGVIVVKVGLADVRRSTRIVVGASNQVRRIATWRTNAGDLPIVLFEGFGSDEVTAFGREYSVTLVTHEGKDLRLTIHPSVPVMFEPSEANSPEGEFSDTYVWIRNSIGGSDLGGVLAHELGHALAVTHGRMFCDEYNREMHREQNEVYGCMNRLSECCSRAPDMAGSCRISVSNASNRIECYGAPYLTPDLMLDAEHGEAPFRSIMGPASLNEGDFHIFPSGIRGHSCPARTNPYQPGCAHVLNPQE